MQVAVGVYAFVVVKNSDKQIDITKDYQKLFDSYNETGNKEIIDLVQSSVSTFTFYYYFAKFREFFEVGRLVRKSFWF